MILNSDSSAFDNEDRLAELSQRFRQNTSPGSQSLTEGERDSFSSNEIATTIFLVVLDQSEVAVTRPLLRQKR